MTKQGREIRVEMAIVGGGLSGLTLGIACAAAGLEVAVIDREDPARTIAGPYDGRTTAIAYGSQQVMNGIGAWPGLAENAEPIREIRVADGESPLFLHYDHRDLGPEPLGYIIENRLLRQGLYARARALPSLKLLAPVAVERVDYAKAGATLKLSDGRRLHAQLVAAADGRASRLREAAGIKTRSAAYRQTAIVCTVRHAEPHRGVAVEHFRAPGPFAILPMRGNRSSIVWTESDADATHMLGLDEPSFLKELERRFGDYLGTLAVEGPRWSYPLSFLHAEAFSAPRLALVGDAAHVIHPIAGQGWNLGVRDIAALAELAVDASRLGLDIGAQALLERYERWRRFDVLTLSAVTDGLNRLFATNATPAKLLRDLGLGAVHRAPMLKRFFMRQAMGCVGDLPRLARGEAL